MSRRLLCVCVLLVGCSSADGAVTPGSVEPADLSALPLHEQLQADVARSRGHAQERLRAAQHAPAEAVQAAAQLAVTCPYARASWQLAFALHEEAARIPDAHISPAALDEWRTLREGLAAHVATLEALQIDLAPPGFGDHLFGYLPDDAIVTRAELAQAEDPVLATLPLLNSIASIVSAYPPDVQDQLSERYGVIADALDDSAPLSHQMKGWRASLERLRSHAHEPAVQVWLSEAVGVLDVWRQHGC